jgi:hypothetical protein
MVVFLGLGRQPELVATVIFCGPPAVRLTMLGIQQVPQNTVEAAHAFGATPWQTLRKVELPQALPTIMAGVNQVIMLALSMVVIAALVGSGGLGEAVVRGLSQLDVGRAFIGGVGIVVIAIYLDRVTRPLGSLIQRKPGAKSAFSKVLPGRKKEADVGSRHRRLHRLRRGRHREGRRGQWLGLSPRPVSDPRLLTGRECSERGGARKKN